MEGLVVCCKDCCKNVTSCGKKTGAAKAVIAIIAACSVLIAVGAAIYKATKERGIPKQAAKKHKAPADGIYTVSVKGKSDEGLAFELGDTFKILEANGDAGLIEKIGDLNNPYFVSLEFLSSISDYEI